MMLTIVPQGRIVTAGWVGCLSFLGPGNDPTFSPALLENNTDRFQAHPRQGRESSFKSRVLCGKSYMHVQFYAYTCHAVIMVICPVVIISQALEFLIDHSRGGKF